MVKIERSPFEDTRKPVPFSGFRSRCCFGRSQNLVGGGNGTISRQSIEGNFFPFFFRPFSLLFPPPYPITEMESERVERKEERKWRDPPFLIFQLIAGAGDRRPRSRDGVPVQK